MQSSTGEIEKGRDMVLTILLEEISLKVSHVQNVVVHQLATALVKLAVFHPHGPSLWHLLDAPGPKR